jgi:hypothetical protein
MLYRVEKTSWQPDSERYDHELLLFFVQYLFHFGECCVVYILLSCTGCLVPPSRFSVVGDIDVRLFENRMGPETFLTKFCADHDATQFVIYDPISPRTCIEGCVLYFARTFLIVLEELDIFLFLS